MTLFENHTPINMEQRILNRNLWYNSGWRLSSRCPQGANQQLNWKTYEPVILLCTIKGLEPFQLCSSTHIFLLYTKHEVQCIFKKNLGLLYLPAVNMGIV